MIYSNTPLRPDSLAWVAGSDAPVDMAALMGLTQNGQGITLSSSLKAAGVTDPEAPGSGVRKSGATLVLAQTFPTGTHALWLYYWLAAHGIHPLSNVRTLVVPPSQMVAHLRARRIGGFCAGERWGALATKEGVGFTLATSQSIWPDYPEKVLGCTRAFVEAYPNTARALVMAVLEASRFIDESQVMRNTLLMDGSRWDGSDPAAYAGSFALHALADYAVRDVAC